MLRFISIDNYTLIDHLEVEFRNGLNLITGETGSGKSILVDAVGLLIGARASQEMVREGYNLARVEGIFTLKADHLVRQRLREASLESGSDDLVIRREISLTGANRVFINGRISTLNQLVELGVDLVDIHGQHEQQGLLQPGNHLEFLDAYGRNRQLRQAVGEVCRKFRDVQERIRRIQDFERERWQRRDLLRYQVSEIDRLKLEVGLDSRLQEERRLLSSAEKRSQRVRESYDLLYEREESVLTMLDQVSQRLTDLAELDDAFSETSEKVREIYYQLEEIAFQTRDYAETIEFSPTRLEQVEERLAEIERTKRKYGDTIEDVLDYVEQIRQEVGALESEEAELEELLSERRELEQNYENVSRQLSEQRHASAVQLSAAVEHELADLAMRETRFEIRFEPNQELVSEKGIDSVEFLISPNPGEPPRPLAKIASGGELSRIMLALKSVLKIDESPTTLVFDEIDAGIGGRVAKSLGEKLYKLATRNQVFCVTHLPQIAALANQHFHVGKHTRGERTIVELIPLDREGRIEEISRMLAGDAVTSTTRRQARELMAELPEGAVSRS